MTLALHILITLALAGTFFGKAVIGIGLGLAVILSCLVIAMNRQGFTRAGAIRFVKSGEIIGLALMLLVWLAACLNGLYPDQAVTEWAKILGYSIGGILLFLALSRHTVDFNVFMKAISLLCGLCGFLMLMTAYVPDIMPEWGSSYGSVLVVFLPMAFVLLVRGGRQWLWALILFFMVAGIGTSDGRTAWFGGVLFFILAEGFIWLSPALQRMTRVLLTAGMVFIFLLGGMTGLASYHLRMGDEYASARQGALLSDRPASGRLIVWADSFNKIQDDPILGVGIGGSEHLNIHKSETEFVRHPHNIILEITLETGMIGFAAFLGFLSLFITPFISAYRSCTDETVRAQALAIATSAFLYGFCSLSLTSIFNTWWILYAVVLAVLLKLAERACIKNT